MTSPAPEDDPRADRRRLDPRLLRDLLALMIIGVSMGGLLVAAWTWNWHAGLAVLSVEGIVVGVAYGTEA